MLHSFKRFLPRKEASLLKKLTTWFFTLIAAGALLGTIGLFGLIAILSLTLPSVNDLEKMAAAESTEIFDRNGELIYTIHGEENREQVDLDKIAPSLIDATIAIEDDTFWEHKGFDMMAIGRAALSEFLGIGGPRGGSTITQQYIKNAFLSSERTYTRKLKELILSIRLERNFDKEKIIELYLNRIPYGNNAYGAQKAAEIYFNKNANELTLAESAILASLPQAPSRYNPYGDYRYPVLLREFSEDEAADIDSELDLNLEDYARGLIGKSVELSADKSIYIQGRSDLVLKRMHELDLITKEERQQALNELQSIEFSTKDGSLKHPHFVLYIKQLLEDRYGKDIVERGGLKVYTTIDLELQKYAEQVALETGESNESRYGANNIAILSANARTGEILAMVGSRDYFNEDIDGNVNVTIRPRQPGSSFKPIVYAQAFYEGYSPGNVIYDIPTKIGNDRPQNYDGTWLGQITIREALGKSRNIPAIKAYYLAGRQSPIIELASRMGITTLSDSHSYGYPLALGAGEVPLSEMVTAFGTFANSGKRPELTGILKIENANGDILEEFKPEEINFPEVLDPQIAYLISDILADRSNSVGPLLTIAGKTVAVKTGTSTKTNKKEAGEAGTVVRPSDGWTIGYTPEIVTGIWAGNTDGTGLGLNASGYSIASPAFNKVMTKALSGKADEPFPRPEGIKEIQISKASGLLPSANTPEDMIVTEKFASFAVPTAVENLFVTKKIDKISGLLATEFTPEDAIIEVTFQQLRPIADMFEWANEIRAYYKTQMAENPQEISAGAVIIGPAPTEYDTVHTAETAAKKPSITIISPASQSQHAPGSLHVEIEAQGDNGIDVVEYFIDNKKEYFSRTAPYTGYLNISRFFEDGSHHLIVAKVIDKLGYSASSAIEIKVEKAATPTD